jgi:hypothetical protein
MTIVGQKNIAKGTRSELPVGDATLNIVVRKFNGIMIFGPATHYCQKFVPISCILASSPKGLLLLLIGGECLPLDLSQLPNLVVG